jgi:hypothetical protein
MNWIKERLKERTTLDGAILIAAGAAFIVLGPLAKLAAYGAIVYGIFTIVKKG